RTRPARGAGAVRTSRRRRPRAGVDGGRAVRRRTRGPCAEQPRAGRRRPGRDAPLTMVHTVRGPVPADHLGPTLMHEHVFVVDAEYAWNYYPAEEVADHIAAAAAQLNAAYEAGVRTIVDCTVLGVGRIVPWLREVAALTPINIV